MLAKRNSHPRDSLISFVEETHVYTVDGKKYKSVTTVIHDFFPKFDADHIIDKMMRSSNFWSGKYRGMTKREIKDQWEHNRVEAANAGTNLHKDIENFINGDLPENPDSTEFIYFLNFWHEIVIENFKPYRTEWIIHSKDGIAGSIDCVLVNEDDELVLLDWKRSKEIKMTNQWEKGYGPFKHFDNCNYNHYTLQLNIYRHILESEYSKKVIGMFNVVLHPNADNYQLIEIKEINVKSFWAQITEGILNY